MCTVTFVPARDKIFITSNRDEKNSRAKAMTPSCSYHNGWKLLYPKDAEAGGTWIGLKETGDAAVLLNGAFIKHHSQPPYRKSRGIIFLDLLTTKNPSISFHKIDLINIEPFTFILFEKGCLYQFRWDGNEKFYKQLSVNRSHIWSSATLYDGFVVKKREEWFASFLNLINNPTQQDVLNFHRFSGEGDSENDLLMKRDTTYSTVSITSILLTKDRGSMKHLDLVEDKTSEIKIELLFPISIL